MECIPAIDIRGGRSVRLLQGVYSAETVYGDPLEQALGYAAAGATRLHVVDLDAARTGEGTNDGIVAAIAARAGVPVEVGGGMRSMERAASLIEMGVERVIVGTLAVEQPELLEKVAREFPGRIAVGLDHRRAPGGDGSSRREVAVRGWEVGSGLELGEALARMSELELAAFIVTDIDRDGTLEGPDLEGLAFALAATETPVIASGGVGTVEDLAALRALEVGGRRLAGVVIGKAIVSGAMSLEEARRACAA